MSALKDYTYFTTTRSLCPRCNALVEAKVVLSGGKVYFLKHCPKDGPSQALVSGDADWYLRSLTYLKPGTLPKASSVASYKGCPESCGLCPEHQQHTCVPIIEITDHCNLKCPICLVKNANSRHMGFDDFRRILDTLERCEGTLNLVNLSGGEPLLHPELERFIEHLAGRASVVKASISTNGLLLPKKPELVPFLRDRGVVVSLQLDGFDGPTLERLRGADLSGPKRRILALLEEEGAPYSMTVTLAKGHNEAALPELLERFFKSDHALSMMLQPSCFAGTGAGYRQDPLERLTIPDVVKLLAAGSGGVLRESDFMPLPCSHPACFALTYLLRLSGGRYTPIPRLFGLDDYLDVIKNNALFGMDEGNVARIKDAIYRLWTASGAIPDREATLKAIKAILSGLESVRGGFSPRQVMSVTEKHVKSIFIHHFMDAHNFDLSRAVKCCQQYPLPDGRLMPACVHNNLTR